MYVLDNNLLSILCFRSRLSSFLGRRGYLLRFDLFSSFGYDLSHLFLLLGLRFVFSFDDGFLYCCLDEGFSLFLDLLDSDISVLFNDLGLSQSSFSFLLFFLNSLLIIMLDVSDFLFSISLYCC